MDEYIRCPYCSKCVGYNDKHLENCFQNYNNETILWCFSCGVKNKEYSKTQLNKEGMARCIECVKSGKVNKYEPYDYLYRKLHNLSKDKLKKMCVEKQLEVSISKLNLKEVNELLLLNPNVNYIFQDTFYDTKRGHEHILLYNKDGSEKQVLKKESPNTPLKICVFMFSNILLSDSDRMTIIEIAKQLIKSGASVIEGKEYYELLYGNEPSKSLWNTFYVLLNKTNS